MISQHWFRWWLDAARQQAITWANVDPELYIIYIHSQPIHIWHKWYWHNYYLEQYDISIKYIPTQPTPSHTGTLNIFIMSPHGDTRPQWVNISNTCSWSEDSILVGQRVLITYHGILNYMCINNNTNWSQHTTYTWMQKKSNGNRPALIFFQLQTKFRCCVPSTRAVWI